MFALAVSKSLYTVSDDDLTIAVALMLETYAQHMADTLKDDSVPDHVQFYMAMPDGLDATHSSDDRRAREREYTFSFSLVGPNSTPVLKTDWPQEYAPADLLSILRVLAHGFHNHALTQMEPHVSYGFFGFLMRSIAMQYVMDPSLATQSSSVTDVPRNAMDHTLQTMRRVFG